MAQFGFVSKGQKPFDAKMQSCKGFLQYPFDSSVFATWR